MVCDDWWQSGEERQHIQCSECSLTDVKEKVCILGLICEFLLAEKCPRSDFSWASRCTLSFTASVRGHMILFTVAASLCNEADRTKHSYITTFATKALWCLGVKPSSVTLDSPLKTRGKKWVTGDTYLVNTCAETCRTWIMQTATVLFWHHVWFFHLVWTGMQRWVTLPQLQSDIYLIVQLLLLSVSTPSFYTKPYPCID